VATEVPTYKASVVGGPGNAGGVNQFLVPHNAAFIYDGVVLTSSQSTGDGNYTTTQDQYLSQQFQTAATQTAISQVWLQISTVGGSAITNNITPLVVGIYADSGGEPTGSALVSASLSETAVYASGFWVVVPLPVTGLLSSTTYHLVVSPAGDSSSYYVWQNNNQVGGGSTSPDFVLWTDQSFGFMYRVYDQTFAGGSLVTYVIEDGGDRWTQYGYDATDEITSITEYTVDQTGSGSLNGTRTLTYTNGFLTGVN
jgi:hypothetical protein